MFAFFIKILYNIYKKKNERIITVSMKKMDNIDYQIFTTIASMDQNTLLKFMYNFLKKYYPKDSIIVTPYYILCKGNISAMLVAHLDTVFKTPPTNIYYDSEQRVMWSPQGLGADDRAGVFSIIKIIQEGYRPCLCLTTDEELGGVGASILIKKYPKSPFRLKYIIELDRQGSLDCVFYTCNNPKFQKFVESYGFITSWGSYSDISTICPAWEIAGVNLSVGYFNEHEKIETLHTDILYKTIKKVELMLDDIYLSPTFKYIPMTDEEYFQHFYDYYTTPIDKNNNIFYCKKCKQAFSTDEMINVEEDDKSISSYCLKCVNDKTIRWCNNCGQAFKSSNSQRKYCQHCS